MCLGWDSSHLPSGSWAINSQHSWQLGRWVPGPNRLSWCWLHPDSLALSSNSPHLGMAPPGSSLAFFFSCRNLKKKFNLVSVSPAPMIECVAVTDTHGLHQLGLILDYIHVWNICQSSWLLDGLPDELIYIPEGSEPLIPMPCTGQCTL